VRGAPALRGSSSLSVRRKTEIGAWWGRVDP